MPPIKSVEIAKIQAQENRKTEQVKAEEFLKDDLSEVVEDEVIEEIKEEKNEDVDIKKTPTPKKSTSKHVIIANKKRDNH